MDIFRGLRIVCKLAQYVYYEISPIISEFATEK
jgi:hypothetical protein